MDLLHPLDHNPQRVTTGGMIQVLGFTLLLGFWILLGLEEVASHGAHSFAKIGIQQVTFALTDAAYVKDSPTILGSNGQNSEWVTVYISNLKPSIDDWIGVFSHANFSGSTCLPENSRVTPLYLCSAPIKICIYYSDYMWTSKTGGNFKYSCFCKPQCTKLPTISLRKDVE